MALRVICGPAAERRCVFLRSRGPQSGHRSGFAAGAEFFIAQTSKSIGELELGWQFVRVPGHRHHRDQRQDDDDGVDRADAECLRPAHHRLRQHRQTAVRSRARRNEVRRADGRSELVSARNDSNVFVPQISVWLNFAPDHLDRYRLGRGISRGQAAHFRKSDRRGRRGRKCERRIAGRSNRGV